MRRSVIFASNGAKHPNQSQLLSFAAKIAMKISLSTDYNYKILKEKHSTYS